MLKGQYHEKIVCLNFEYFPTDAEVANAFVVPPSQPRTEEGLYWGYSVRLAHTFSAVFTQSPFKQGYDMTVGTSERGTPVDEIGLSRFK